MPLPKPKSNESKDEFVGRCISSISKEKDDKGNKRWPDQEQKIAVCFSQWERKDESEVINKIDMYINESVVVGDVATYEKPISMGKNSYIQKRKDRWVYVEDENDVDSDIDLESLKKRIKKVE